MKECVSKFIIYLSPRRVGYWMDCIMIRRGVTVLFTPWKTPRQIFDFENIVESTFTVLHGGKLHGRMFYGVLNLFSVSFFVSPWSPVKAPWIPVKAPLSLA